LKEICFTDHFDYNSEKEGHHDLFTIEDYNKAYGDLKSESVKIRNGVEFGLTTWNRRELAELLNKRHFDFVLGSVHYVGGTDPYFEGFWDGISFSEAVEKYLLQTLKCVKEHDDFDVLGHITYVCKSVHNPTKGNAPYSSVSDITDEILKIVIEKGKGIEVNTSGVDRIGDFLPSYEYVKRFFELGGEIITVGSDSHDKIRVGQYINDAVGMISEFSSYVCTFENRRPVFHKIKG
jgi:histidinol-phosphatase (PHP family)